MSSRRLCFILLFALCCATVHAQSLGDVARASRAEREKRSIIHSRVITNDDLATDTRPSEESEKSSDVGSSTVSTDAASSTNGTAATPKSADQANSANPVQRKLSERELQELELQKRTAEIDQRYLSRIADLRAQIEAAKAEVKKLQTEQAASTAEFRRTNGASPAPGAYDQQQRSLAEQMEIQRGLIADLTVKLEDAKEAARHAGVAHATD